MQLNSYKKTRPIPFPMHSAFASKMQPPESRVEDITVFTVKAHCADLMRWTGRILSEMRHIEGLIEIFRHNPFLPFIPEIKESIIPELIDKFRRDVDPDLSFQACELLYYLAFEEHYLMAIGAQDFREAAVRCLKNRSGDVRLKIVVLQTLVKLLEHPLTVELFRDFDLGVLHGNIEGCADLGLHSAVFQFLGIFSENPLSDEVRMILLGWASEVNPSAGDLLGNSIARLLLNLIRVLPFDVEFFLGTRLRSFVLDCVGMFPLYLLQFFVEFQIRFPDFRSALAIAPRTILDILSQDRCFSGVVFYTLMNLHRCGLVNLGDSIFAEIPAVVFAAIKEEAAGTVRLAIAFLANMITDNPDFVFGRVAFDDVCSAFADGAPMLACDFVTEAVVRAFVAMKNWTLLRGIHEKELAIAAETIHERLQDLDGDLVEEMDAFVAAFPGAT
jgi:hypothetical protein